MIAGHSPAIWLIFVATVGTLLAVDLGIIGRIPALSVRQSAWWSLTVVAVAALFGGVVWQYEGRTEAVQYATGYVVEFSLSVDNLLVFLMVLRYFAVPVAAQPTVLKWGILGAILMRGLVIGAGTLILNEFHWVIYLFGALLIVTAVKMFATPGETDINLDRNPLLRAARRVLPVSDRFEGNAFVARVGGKRLVTPLLLVVLVIEWTDLVFATDSIPAIFAITRDPFLVFTSNIFAVVGLRALFLVLAAMLARFAYLRFGVAAVLLLVGTKMLLGGAIAVPPLVSLGVIVGVLATAIALSAWKRDAG